MTQSNPVNWIYTYVMLSGWGGVSWFVYEVLQPKSNLTIGSSIFLGVVQHAFCKSKNHL